MNKRQKKKLFQKTMGWNPPDCLIYTSLDYHVFIGKPWGGLAALKKQEATSTEDKFRGHQNRIWCTVNERILGMNQEGLLFPKGTIRKKRKKHHKSIIDRDAKGQCFICGKTGYTERHHIYGSANRKYSEQYGLTVYLCPECHRTSEIAVHRNKEVRTTLQRIGQRTFEKKCGSREEFVKLFGKNYLEDENEHKSRNMST